MNIFIKLFITQSTILVGGQAVIEGVMMRVPGAYATAVKNSSGEIEINRQIFNSRIHTYPWLNMPIIRGIISLGESLRIGYFTLQWSAQISTNEGSELMDNKLADIFATFISIILAISLFFAAPIFITSNLFEEHNNVFLFNIISGFFRILFFLIYLILISLMQDVRRLFQYHGAEHKAVYNFESGRPLNINNAQQFPTYHPRCGTSFIFIIMIVAILTFAIIDSVLLLYIDKLSPVVRFAYHIPFIPIVAGMGFEILKITAKHRNNILFRSLSLPGLWLQRITTKQPSDEQVDIALSALREAFGGNLEKYSGRSFIAEAV